MARSRPPPQTHPHILQRLSVELVDLVLQHMELEDAKSLSMINKAWRKLAESNVLHTIDMFYRVSREIPDAVRRCASRVMVGCTLYDSEEDRLADMRST